MCIKEGTIIANPPSYQLKKAKGDPSDHFQPLDGSRSLPPVQYTPLPPMVLASKAAICNCLMNTIKIYFYM